MKGAVHVVGAGLAGLAAAVALAKAGRPVFLHEAAGQAGGRCRSYFDATLGAEIDNGNHLVLSGNRAALGFLNAIGAADALTGPPHAVFDFADVATGERWRIAMDDGRVPTWVFDKTRRVPGTGPLDYLALLPLVLAGRGKTVGALIKTQGELYRRLIEPLLVAALNTDAPSGSAALAGAVIRETMMKGGLACRPLVATHGLSKAFVAPALKKLAELGAPVVFGHRLRAIAFNEGAATELDFGEEKIALEAGQTIVLAVPAPVATSLLPGLGAPTEFRAIVNGHFAIDPPKNLPSVLGIVGGTAEWLFSFEGRLSTTTSNADRLCDLPREELAQKLWADVAKLAGVDGPMPRWQIVRERRATFAALCAEDAKRPPARTAWRNLVLAGDWTQTGLPATIEGAIRSGNRAANLVLQGHYGIPRNA